MSIINEIELDYSSFIMGEKTYIIIQSYSFNFSFSPESIMGYRFISFVRLHPAISGYIDHFIVESEKLKSYLKKYGKLNSHRCYDLSLKIIDNLKEMWIGGEIYQKSIPSTLPTNNQR